MISILSQRKEIIHAFLQYVLNNSKARTWATESTQLTGKTGGQTCYNGDQSGEPHTIRSG